MNVHTERKTDTHRIAVSLVSKPDFVVAVRYEPAQRSLRVLHGGIKRLFFYEPDAFFAARGALLNEYGSVVGKLNLRAGGKGFIYCPPLRLRVQYQPGRGQLLLQHPELREPIHWHFGTPEGNLDKLNPEMFRALLLLLAWCAHVPAQQLQQS